MSPEVAEALAAGRPVVALESTLIAHGLPRPRNLDLAHELERLLRDRGVVPATIAVIDGVPRIGLDDAELALIAGALDDHDDHDDHDSHDSHTGSRAEAPAPVAKLSVRDLPAAAALGVTGATTVASTSLLAAQAGIRVFATGGLGGVHRDGNLTFDESADLVTLARVPVTVVCAGVKSILDVPATLERLETLGVTVLGWQTSTFPGFYLATTGIGLDWQVDDAGQVAATMAARDALGLRSALVLANPVAEADQLDPELHDRVLADALGQAAAAGLHGKAVTPFLLATFHKATSGASLELNVTVVRNNTILAAEIATAWAGKKGLVE